MTTQREEMRDSVLLGGIIGHAIGYPVILLVGLLTDTTVLMALGLVGTPLAWWMWWRLGFKTITQQALEAEERMRR